MSRNPTLSESIEEYLTYQQNAYAKATAGVASQALRQFLAVVGNVQVRSLGPQHSERFQAHLLGKGNLPNTVNTKMSQLSRFGKWMVAHRYISTSFTGTVRRLPVQAAPRLRVPIEDFPRLLDCASRGDERMIVAIGLFLFLRGGEISTLRIGDVDLDMGAVNATIHKTKGWDEMPVCYELDQEFRRWFVEYAADIQRPLRASDYLIPRHRRYPGWLPRGDTGNYIPDQRNLLPFRNVQRVLDKAGYPIADDAGRSNGEGVHTLRRSGARAMFDALVEGRLGDTVARDSALRLVMTQLHHKNISTTEKYIGLDADRKRRDLTIRGKRMFVPAPANVVSLTVAQ